MRPFRGRMPEAELENLASTRGSSRAHNIQAGQAPCR